MLRYCAEKWNKNKKFLEYAIRSIPEKWEHWSYEDLVKFVVIYILNDAKKSLGFASDEYDSDNITEIDNGEYQGTLLFTIPKKVYQPGAREYLLTYVDYGSCSGCDTLQDIHMSARSAKDKGDEEKEMIVKDYLSLCLHLLQNMVKPYNSGWMYDPMYNIVEEDAPGC